MTQPSTRQIASSYHAMQPTVLWDVFALLGTIPRPSFQENRIQAALADYCRNRGFEVAKDTAENVVVRVPASPGREKAPIVILQAHVDMVTIAAPGKEHDFERDPVTYAFDERDGRRVLKAEGTTLGADNGIGVALALAAAVDPALPRGPLEILLTTNEESGMTGAKELDGTLLAGKLLINLDSEEDDALYVGCVGGEDCFLKFDPPTAQTMGTEACLINVEGFPGGHSGIEIHTPRGNSIKTLRELLQGIDSDFQISSFVGGERHNAIPITASAVIVGKDLLPTLRENADKIVETLRQELGDFGKNVRININATDAPKAAYSLDDSKRILDAIASIEHGALEYDGEVLFSSANLAIVEESDEGLSILQTTRSLSRDGLARINASSKKLAERLGFNFEANFKYPPWQPVSNSKLQQTLSDSYTTVVGEKPKVETIHGGLECAILGDQILGAEMISMGPTIRHPHTPEEYVYIDSVEKIWKVLSQALHDLSA